MPGEIAIGKHRVEADDLRPGAFDRREEGFVVVYQVAWVQKAHGCSVSSQLSLQGMKATRTAIENLAGSGKP